MNITDEERRKAESKPKLKPCPFCGGDAYCFSSDDGDDYLGRNVWVVEIGCESCGVMFHGEYHGDDIFRDDDIEGETCHTLEEYVTVLWNRRIGEDEKLAEVVE